MNPIPRRHRLNKKDFQAIFGKRWKDYAREIVLVDASPAARFMFDQYERYGPTNVPPLPCITPPWPLAWAQYAADLEKGDSPVGVLAISFQWEDDTEMARLRSYERLMHLARIAGRAAGGAFDHVRLAYPPTGTVWITAMVSFVRILISKRLDYWKPASGAAYAVYDDGSGTMIARTHETDDYVALTTPAIIAFSFAHCKNIEIEARSNPPTSQMFEPHGKVIYRTIDIAGALKRAESENVPGETDADRAFHLCRGHFKDFREKGLFGKHKSIYWWDMHARGSKQSGEIVKKYRLHERD